MKKFARICLGVGGFGLLLLVLTPITEHRAAANSPLSVTVSNVPVPVQGTVSVGNAPSVNVANTPSVSVVNTPAVNVANTAVPISNALGPGGTPLPLSVAAEGQPYQDSCASAAQSACNLQAVPANMRLVIKEVDMSIDTAPTDKILAGGAIEVSVNGNYVFHTLLLTQQGVGATDAFWIVHQPTTLYNDANTNPVCHAFSVLGPLKLYCAISGYLVPAQ